MHIHHVSVTAMQAVPSPSPSLGIIGSHGAYGRWLRGFFEAQMGIQVIGHDPADLASHTLDEVLDAADVLLFSAPIRSTPALIAECVRRCNGREQGRLWLDITSIKAAPVAAMLHSKASVVGLHPMTAPPKAPTLKGRVLVVCEARLEPRWQAWMARLYRALEAECVHTTPEHHDKVMALVQAMVHATHLAEAGVLREYAPLLGDLGALQPYRSTAFALDTAILTRILALNPAIYEDIQFDNPYSLEVLDRLLAQLQRLRGLLGQGDDKARQRFRTEFLDANRAAIGQAMLDEGNYSFERLGYLLADLTEPRSLSVHLPEDGAGSLRKLLLIFEHHGLSLSSIHSSRTPAGEVHFRFGLDAGCTPKTLADVAQAIDRSGVGRVLNQGQERVPTRKAEQSTSQ